MRPRATQRTPSRSWPLSKQTIPRGDPYLITDNLSSHSSLETRTWLEAHPRLHHVFIPTGACWLNWQEGWWRLFRHEAFAGQSFANPKEIDQARRVATKHLN